MIRPVWVGILGTVVTSRGLLWRCYGLYQCPVCHPPRWCAPHLPQTCMSSPQSKYTLNEPQIPQVSDEGSSFFSGCVPFGGVAFRRRFIFAIRYVNMRRFVTRMRRPLRHTLGLEPQVNPMKLGMGDDQSNFNVS